MKLINLTVNDFITEVNSSSPAPGGGSVSALASSLGVGLLRMVGHLTINKKKFKRLDESIQADFLKTFDSLEEVIEQLKVLIDKDTDAFNEIMKAFKLPKETDTEKELRKQAIEKATIFAIEIPLEVSKISLEVLTKIDLIIEYGNKNALSDIGVSILNIASGIEGALLNVKINIPGLSCDEMKNSYTDQALDILKTTENLKQDLMSKISLMI